MSRRFTEKPVLALCFAFIGGVFFSSKAIMVKLAYQYNVDAQSLLSLRLIFALPVYLIVLLVTFKKTRSQVLVRKDYLKVIMLGFIGYYLASYLDFTGLKYISASLERLILFVYPTMVILLLAIFFKKRPAKKQILAVGVTYFGILLTFLHNETTKEENLILGTGLVFCSAFAYAIYLIGSGKLIPRFGTWTYTSLAMIVSTVAATFHFVIINESDLFGFEMQVYILALAMAVIATVIPSFLISEAIRVIGSSNVAVIGSVGPVSTIILAALFLNERISVFQIAGTLVVIGGVFLLTYGDRNKENKKKREDM